ncbi:MAG: Rieske 2Fe-2S domain-containing protein, partial [Dehalococcoidia bacterium]|nr:Rieske 2Fe-2S domain-containing protein [Dehalococcoidia bacterium]
MGLLNMLTKVRGGYPGGWRSYARGYQGNATPSFVQPEDADDRRSQLPPLGYRDYWYPAIPAKDVGAKKPVGLRMLGEDVVLFKDAKGEVQALWDYCPHRGVYLSFGDCFFKGFLSCPYHGATFDGDGECVEFITEGPDSKMVGRLKARKFPTVTLKGMVFIWMGEGEPAPPEEDIPPELFEGEETILLNTIRYWHCNWMIALENQSDAHNCFWVHRNSFIQLRSRTGGRPRTPMGYRSASVKDVAVVPQRGAERYYADEKGRIPYQMYYPRVGGYWPKRRYRLLWTWFFEFFDRLNAKRPRFDTPEEWRGMHLPGMHRLYFGGPGAMYTRWCVPVDKDLTRVVYFRTMRIKTGLGRAWERLTYLLYRNFLFHYNFSDQDYDAMRTTRYQHT